MVSILSLWIKSYIVAKQMKATDHYFPVVLFIMLYKMVLTFETMNKILQTMYKILQTFGQYLPVVLSIML